MVAGKSPEFFSAAFARLPKLLENKSYRIDMSNETITPDILEQHNLTEEEYRRIVSLMGRKPNLTELGIFSVMWSEHCSYKSSKVHLARLPTSGPRILQGPGENAGIVDIGDGYVAVFKIESHNHPSFIEPYQGAATGVGGILRDIFTMGARPIALLDSLRFGPLSDAKNRSLMEGVVAGIAGYGNCIGVPTVGGEIHFEDCYSRNPLVNVFCLGVARKENIFYGKATGIGNSLIYVGAKTGRDGIHGATMASAEFDDSAASAQEKRPNVQVGDPFLEKLLLEACLEAMKAGAVVGIQDMGAAGLTCSTCEMGARAGTGVEIELDRVPQRETGMTPYEVMLSESQERMLLVTEKDREEEIFSIFGKWGLDAVVIGQVMEESKLRVRRNGEVVAEIPNEALTDEAPRYERPVRLPASSSSAPGAGKEIAGLLSKNGAGEIETALRRLLASSALSGKRWVYEQYDHMVRTNTVVEPGADAAVVRIKGTQKALALKVDGNGRYCSLDPRRGAMLAVAEAARNLVVTGAEPVAVTDCLNFGNPEKPEVMGEFSEVIDGLAEACRVFGTPVTGGNVSFYNETLGRSIFPTPVIGMIGLIEDVDRVMHAAFRAEGRAVVLLGRDPAGSVGPEEMDRLCASFGSSEYMKVRNGTLSGEPPQIDLEFEKRVQDCCRELIGGGVVESAHDVAEGGLLTAILESCFAGEQGLGVRLEVETRLPIEIALFGEMPSRIVFSLEKKKLAPGREIASNYGLMLPQIGTTRKEWVDVVSDKKTVLHCRAEELKTVWQSGLARQLESPAPPSGSP